MRLMWMLVLLVAAPAAADDLVITTWNIETLGADDGRGFAGGFGKASLPPRTDAQLQAIAELISDSLQSDIVAIQEVSLTHRDSYSLPHSRPLDTLIEKLGPGWRYRVPWVSEIPEGHDNLFVAFLYNTDRVRLLDAYSMEVPNHELGGSELFPRVPLVGYFEAFQGGQSKNDFVLVNLHLKSGQENEENHLIAMTVLEHELRRSLGRNGIKESDLIVLGDFNDNPYAVTPTGRQAFSNAMYVHMAFKGYYDLVTSDFHSTRMDENLASIIDHILINEGADKDIDQTKADIYLPGGGDSAVFATWRQTYSDHFPVSFKLKVGNDTDVDF